MILYGPELRRLREAKKISRKELAERTGFHYITIANIETGKKQCGVITLVELFEAIGYVLVPMDIEYIAASHEMLNQ